MSTDWIPFELISIGKRSMVRWIHPGSQALFLEPFFNQTIDALIGANSVQKLTPIEELERVQPVKAPKGFIFHVSRCGSTLVSRSLAGVARHRVISEPAPVNQLLLAENLDPSYKGRLLKGLIHALCGTAENTACFIKFTSWNLLFLEQILALFPTTPWLFIYRDPADVLQSLTARAPRWAGNEQLARVMGDPHSEALERMIFTLESIFKAPLPHLNRLAHLVDYSQLPEAILEIPAHFGLELGPAEQEQIIRMGQYDAKQTGEVKFLARGRVPLPDEVREAISPLNLLYKEWERTRTSRLELPACERQLGNGSEDVHAE